ncbi:MAG TPA: HAMP domain-containing protein, partial [Anaerolineales bacterium]|nr:HAMP domain-containing protein [Anaerolineales bacterium]
MASQGIRRERLVVRRSIRTRLLILLLSMTTISVLAVGYLGINSVQSMGEQAQRISADALRAQAEEYLRQVTEGDARRNDLILERVQRDAEKVAQYAARVFGNPDAFVGGAYWRPEDHMFVGPDGQFMNDETDVSSIFVPDFVEIDEELLEVLEMSAHMNLILPPVYDSDPNTVAVYLAAKQEVTCYYPNINLGAIVPPDFQVTQRPWYVGAAPANNPERRVVWSPVYADATGKGLMVTAAAPVYTDRGEFVGVVGIDVTLQDISASIEENRLLGSGYSFLVDEAGRAIALPERGYQDVLGRSPEPDEVGPDLTGATTPFSPVLEKMMAGSTGFDTLEVEGRELFVAYAPLESTGWSLANVVEAEVVLQAVETLSEGLETSIQSLLLTRVLPIGGAVLGVIAVIGMLVARRVAAPIREMAAAAWQIGAGQWDVSLPQAGDDEIGVLAAAF